MPESPEHPGADARGADSKSGETMRASLERTLADAASGAAEPAPPPVPDHTLLRRIGSGAYGDVWLARSALGTMRAVKVVHRARFKDDRPYEREFRGILKYEPISRSHEGLVQVLHAGRDESRGCFYYVMELADADRAEEKGREGAGENLPLSPSLPFSPAQYAPRTLRSDLARQQRLPPVEAAQFVLRLAGALACLHAQGLVHRDIKPSNVIFVGGQPKLADIGLVTGVGSSHSFVGTEGFIPPEGPGTPQADLYGLGKLLYELATGRDRMDFPQLPPIKVGQASRLPRERVSASGSSSASLRSAGAGGTPALLSQPDGEALLELNEVMTRACAPAPEHRYASAAELQAELNLFLAGRSLRRARNVERNLSRLKNFAVTACVFLALGAGALWFAGNEARHARERERAANARAMAEAESRVAEAESREKETVLRQRAEAAEQKTEQQLHTALLEQARATVRSGELGQRVRALDAIRRAAAISNTVELRREVFAALALPDLRFERELPAGPNLTIAELDPAFERIAIARGSGPLEIRAVSDWRLLASLPASTNRPAYNADWSADGSYLAVKRDYTTDGARADWEIWEVSLFSPSRESERRAPARPVEMRPVRAERELGAPIQVQGSNGGARRVMVVRDVPWNAVALHPRLRRLMAGDARGRVTIWDLDDSREAGGFQLAGGAVSLQFAPDGERFAAFYPLGAGWIVSVHAATNGAPLASHVFADYVRTFAWHPDGRWLAVADTVGTIHRMESDTGETRVVGRHKVEAVTTVFSPDGDYLMTGGWERELICWDARTMQRAFTIALDGWHAQIRADGRACALRNPQRVQLHAFERPTAHREFGGELGSRVRRAAFSPDGRWLAAAAEKRMGVWDLAANGPPALAEESDEAYPFFTRDGRELFCSRGFRRRLTPATNAATPPRLERLSLGKPDDFTFLCLGSNFVVLTGARGSQVLNPEELETGKDGWARTYSGISAVSPDGRWLAIYRAFSPSLYIYRLPGLERVAKLNHPANIGDAMFSPLGDEVAVSSNRGGVEFWSTQTWERTRVLTNFIRLLYAPDGRAWWLTKDLRTAGLYDARTLEPRLMLPTGMLPLACSPDGRQIAVSVDARRLQVWDLSALRAAFKELGLDWADR